MKCCLVCSKRQVWSHELCSFEVLQDEPAWPYGKRNAILSSGRDAVLLLNMSFLSWPLWFDFNVRLLLVRLIITKAHLLILTATRDLTYFMSTLWVLKVIFKAQRFYCLSCGAMLILSYHRLTSRLLIGWKVIGIFHCITYNKIPTSMLAFYCIDNFEVIIRTKVY